MLIGILVLYSVQDVGARRPMAVKVGKGDTRVTCLEGTAQVLARGETAWSPLQLNDSLYDGDTIKTGAESRMEIMLPDSSRLRFADMSHFRIVQIEVCKDSQSRNVRVNLVLGKTWANVSKTLGVKSNFELSSENAVAGVRGTVYRMNVYDDQSALVRVYDGEVAVSGGVAEAEAEVGKSVPMYTTPHKVEGPTPVPGPRKVTMEEWTYIIRSMQQIRIGADGVAQAPRGFTEEEDRSDWVDWNKKLDVSLDSTSEAERQS